MVGAGPPVGRAGRRKGGSGVPDRRAATRRTRRKGRPLRREGGCAASAGDGLALQRPEGQPGFFGVPHDQLPVGLRATYSSAHPWKWPGGVAEPGERPSETAVRECLEETGLRVEGPPKLLATVFGLPGKGWPLATAEWMFDGGRLTPKQLAGIMLGPDEDDEVRALAVPEWQGLMPGRDHARL
ncbi:NUDIX domain-containing protein [Streptomyces sp. NPDC096033]|uniref:NUDIX domain-containing protein n=1 Tax=Streptomyces sp. NPDC096033 TaxID=3366071 RepID=UPI00380F1210